jgi:uncharacterized protein YkwD
MAATLTADPTTTAPGGHVNLRGTGFDPKVKFTLTTVDANGTVSGFDTATQFPTNINRVQRDGSFSVGIYAPPVIGAARVEAFQGSTKVATVNLTIATTPTYTVSGATDSSAVVVEVNKRRAAGWKDPAGVKPTLPPVGPIIADTPMFKAAVASVTDSAQTGTSVHHDWISAQLGGQAAGYIAEVIGHEHGYPTTPVSFVDAWMGSDEHRTILMTARVDSAGFAWSKTAAGEVYFAGELVDYSAVPTPAPAPQPIPSAPAFLSRPVSGQIRYADATDVEIKGKTIRGFGGADVAIVLNRVKRAWIHDVDFADMIGFIYAVDCEDIRITDCRGRNVGDGTIGSGHSNFIQFSRTHGGEIARNLWLGGNVEDNISIFESGGKSSTAYLTVHDNVLVGLDSDTAYARAWTRASGTGIILGDGSTGSWIDVYNNKIYSPGQVGIQIIGGIGHRVHNNDVCARPRAGKTNPNVGISSYQGDPHAEVFSNRVSWQRNDGSFNSHWWGAGSINDHDNDWSAALDPTAIKKLVDSLRV